MKSWRLFIAIFVVVLFVSYGSIYLFARSSLYCRYTSSIADVAPCFKFDVHDVAADVVLVGDSALLYAIRPTEVAAAGGPSTYNYGLVGPSFAFDPAAVIDRYLAQNRRPRAIVLYFSPWDLVEPGRITDPRWFPSAVLALQHGGFHEIAQLFRARPSALVEIPPTVVRSMTFDTSLSDIRRAAMEADGGRLDFAGLSGAPADALEGRCPPAARPAEIPVGDRTRQAFASLRARYRRQNIALYVFVAPTAVCDRAVGAIRRAYAGIADNVPQALPDRLFVADSSHQHVHVVSDGATETSRLLARFLIDRMPSAVAR